MKKDERLELFDQISEAINGARSDDAMVALAHCMILCSLAIGMPKHKLFQAMSDQYDHLRKRLREREKATEPESA